MHTKRYIVFFNEAAGTAASLGLSAGSLKELFDARGIDADIVTDWREDLAGAVKHAITEQPDAIVAAGGDGTVSGVAEHLVGSNVPLLILPLGTANLLARDLGIALEIEEWFEALPLLGLRRIDGAEVNGRFFLHLVVVGLMPGIAAERERARRTGGWNGFATFMRAMALRFSHSRRIDVALTCDDGRTEELRVSAVAVGNNQFDEGFGRIFSRQSLEDGKLSIYLLKRVSVWAAIRLAFEMVVGTWRKDELINLREGQSVTISRGRKPRKVRVMFDGEPEVMQSPLSFKVLPQALPVLAPNVLAGDAVTEPEPVATTNELPPLAAAV